MIFLIKKLFFTYWKRDLINENDAWIIVYSILILTIMTNLVGFCVILYVTRHKMYEKVLFILYDRGLSNNNKYCLIKFSRIIKPLTNNFD